MTPDIWLKILEIVIWPLVICGLAVFGILKFRKELGPVVRRIKKVGVVEMSADQQVTQVKSIKDEVIESLSGAAIEGAKKMFLEELDRRKTLSPSDREDFLLLMAAGNFVSCKFERTYRLIFGSQIHALQLLNSRGSGGAEEHEIQVAFYLPASKLHEDFYRNYPFKEWIGFLAGEGLVLRENSRVAISPEGRDFLKYLVNSGYAFERAG